MKKNNTNKNILATSKTNIKKNLSKISLKKISLKKISLKKISLKKISKEQIVEHLAWVPNLFTFANLSLGFLQFYLITLLQVTNDFWLYLLCLLF